MSQLVCTHMQGECIYLLGGGTENQASMWLNTVDVYSPTTHSCMPATSLPKECAYGSAYYVGGGNGIDWFSSMLSLPLNDPQGGQWEQVCTLLLTCCISGLTMQTYAAALQLKGLLISC